MAAANKHVAQCRLILRSWRANPTFDFPPPYDRYGALVASLARDPASARLVAGIVVRIGRADEPAAIDAWASEFAARRKLSWPVAT